MTTAREGLRAAPLLLHAQPVPWKVPEYMCISCGKRTKTTIPASSACLQRRSLCILGHRSRKVQWLLQAMLLLHSVTSWDAYTSRPHASLTRMPCFSDRSSGYLEQLLVWHKQKFSEVKVQCVAFSFQ